MVVRLSARDYSLELRYADGTSPIDVTHLMVELTTQNGHDDLSGLIPTTGNLTLATNARQAFSESLNPRLNPTRWARGARLTVWVADSSGTLRRHPRGALRILKVPAAPRKGRPSLDIQVGCLLSLQDWVAPPGDDAGVERGVSTLRSEAINTLAALAGIGNLVEEISDYPINFSPTRLEGGYVSQMGALAYAAGYRLWIDNQERLRALKFPKSAPKTLRLRLGRDEAVYDPLESQETPPKLLTCFAVYPNVKQTVDPPPQIVISRDDTYSPSQVAVSTWEGMGTDTVIARQEVKQPLGVVMATQYPNNPSLIVASRSANTDFFAGTEGLLEKKEEEVEQPRGVVLPTQSPGVQTLMRASRVLYYPRYQAGQVVGESSYKFEPWQKIAPTATAGTDLLSEYTSTTWQKTNRGFSKSTYTRTATGGRSSVSYSGSGNNQPPAPETQQPAYYEEDTEIEIEVEVGGPGTDDTRPGSLEVPTATSEAQLEEVADLHCLILRGRAFGVELGLDLRDEYLGDSYAPLSRIDVIEEEAGVSHKFRYVVEADTFTLMGRQCAYSCDGIYLGEVTHSGSTPLDADPLEGEETLAPITTTTATITTPTQLQQPGIVTSSELTASGEPVTLWMVGSLFWETQNNEPILLQGATLAGVGDADVYQVQG